MIFCYIEDKGVRDITLTMLEDRNHKCMGFASGRDMVSALETQSPVLVVIDITCEEAISVLEYLREMCNQRGFKILVITQRLESFGYTVTDEEAHLYKPYNMTTFMEAVNNVLSPEITGNVNIEFGILSVDTEKGKVFVKGEKVNITSKEYDLLMFMLDNPDRIFSKEQLYSKVWNSTFIGESQTVPVHIRSLRTKLKDAGEYIKSIYGKGYCIRES